MKNRSTRYKKLNYTYLGHPIQKIYFYYLKLCVVGWVWVWAWE